MHLDIGGEKKKKGKYFWSNHKSISPKKFWMRTDLRGGLKNGRTNPKEIHFLPLQVNFFFFLPYSTSFWRSYPRLLLALLWILTLIHSAGPNTHPSVCFCDSNYSPTLLTLTILYPPPASFYLQCLAPGDFPKHIFKLKCAFKEYLLPILIFAGHMIFHNKVLWCARQYIMFLDYKNNNNLEANLSPQFSTH